MSDKEAADFKHNIDLLTVAGCIALGPEKERARTAKIRCASYLARLGEILNVIPSK